MEILKPFTNDYENEYTASELAKKTGIPQQSASRYANKLYELGFIQQRYDGKNRLFYLDLEKKTSLMVLKWLENDKSIDFFSENQYLVDIADNMIFLGDELILLEEPRSSIDIPYTVMSWTDLELLLKKGGKKARKIRKNHIFFGNINRFVDIMIKNETDDMMDKIHKLEKKRFRLKGLFN